MQSLRPWVPPRDPGKLVSHRAFLRELIYQDPDFTLFELRDALAEAEGVRVHYFSIANLLSRLRLTCIKVAGRDATPSCQRKATMGDCFKHRLPIISA